MEKSKAVVLVSGGLDSATVLAIASSQRYECYAISFDYGQRHKAELTAAANIVGAMDVREHKTIKLDLRDIGGSALTDGNIQVPQAPSEGIPVTYVPARNTIFLSIALGWAEVIGACDIFIGVNAIDYSGYPDCRPEFIDAFERLANLATRSGVQGAGFKLHTPLITLTKAEIIKEGFDLGVDFALTVSCYSADQQGRACGQCDSCRFRRAGFQQAGIPDPTRYYQNAQSS